MKKFVLMMFIIINIISFASVDLRNFVINDFNNALKIGEITGKNIIIMFSSESCYYCKKFKSETLLDDEIQKWLRTEFIFAEIYAERDKKAVFNGKSMTYVELFGAFGVRGTPTFFFFNNKGEPLAQLPGYIEKTTFLTILKYFKYYKKEQIKYDAFLRKNINVNIDKRVLNLKKNDVDFLLKADPNTKEYNKNLDEYVNVIIDKKNKDVEENYFVVIYKK
ncbi:Thioredoxin-related protein [Marinitoga hydrogenitolerans DSM 16785]|uniref:Thioredoxin-related protein n=1 Tax=Marinitoga hydrogenitolerans (strain DSM 16785 / JCM 12826 / AT1271) TaxID=1122195 RepID=A0A1M4Y6N9_MARH1|nr:thioredoxin fold domain-containing protein [Marinitoga hydrogenitolerans]SHF01339.1 Thioredoxin-related protein [Marinitoga hydrogenitolerans DSM 16785]